MNTEVQKIINRKIPFITIGGTSAGLAILGEYIFSASNETAQSSIVLLDPYDDTVTMAGRFLNIPFMDSILTDTHFVARNRMGRMLGFTARIMKDDCFNIPLNATIVHSVGVDEYSALILNTTTGDVRVVGIESSII